MRKKSTIFLRAVCIFIALGMLALAIFAFPQIWLGIPEDYPSVGNAALGIMIIMYTTVIPFYIGLWQVFRILNLIDREAAFSTESVSALRTIKYCSAIIGALFVINVPLLVPIADADDAPGLIVLGMIIASIPISFAVFVAVLQRLLRDAVLFKSENDLTV